MGTWPHVAAVLAMLIMVTASHTNVSDHLENNDLRPGEGTLEGEEGGRNSDQAAPVRSQNGCLSQMWFWTEKFFKNEERFHSLSERFSSRVSRLEDRVSSILLSQSGGTSGAASSGVAQSLEHLHAEIDEIRADMDARNGSGRAGWQFDQPASCERGMGNDVTKAYHPYAILTHASLQREILCDTHTDGGGWIVFQRRSNGDVNFYRDWASYRDGFGSPTGDFWLGNEAVYQLTNTKPYELRVTMRLNGQDLFAEYSAFRIENESSKYRLHIGANTGTAGDGLTHHNLMQFTTFDQDNDVHATVNCALREHGAWWYKDCIRSNLNGKWRTKLTPGVSWNTGSVWTLPYFTEMKIRHVPVKGDY